MKALPDFIEGASAFAAGKFNRKVAETNAVNTERDGTSEAAIARDRARLAIGRQMTAQGASGFQTGTGSALDALRESEIESAYEILNIRRQAASKAQSYRTQGKLAYAEGYNRLSSGVVSGLNKLDPNYGGGKGGGSSAAGKV